MSEAAAAVRSPAVGKDHSFLLRKLHSLSGLVPVGAYMAFHLFENMKAASGEKAFNDMVQEIWKMAPRPVFYLIEIGVLALPILFHSLYGFYIWRTGKQNPTAYGYRRNWMYTLQRWTGLLGFLYIAYHVTTLRLLPGGELRLLRPDASSLTTYAELHAALTPWAATVIYVIGTLSLSFHLGNGFWGFVYSWGLAVGRQAQRYVEYVSWGIILALSAMSLYIIASIHLIAPA